MKLYEVNQAIEDALDRLDVDPETGEMGADAEEVMEELKALDMEKLRILQYLAKVVLNMRSQVAELKAEEQRLKKRRTVIDNRIDRVLWIIDRECEGKKTDLGVATVYYRKTSALMVEDDSKAISWLKKNKYDNCYRIPDPEISKSEVKRLIKAGVDVPECYILENESMSLR